MRNITSGLLRGLSAIETRCVTVACRLLRLLLIGNSLRNAYLLFHICVIFPVQNTSMTSAIAQRNLLEDFDINIGLLVPE